MFRKRREQYNRILSVGRQFTRLVTRLGSPEAAIGELKRISGPPHDRIVERFERLFLNHSAVSDKTVENRIGPYNLLLKLTSLVKQEGGKTIAVFEGFDRMLVSINDQIRVFWFSMSAYITYVSAVLMIAFVVFTTLLIFVIPQFEEVFDAFGARLPALTEWLLSSHSAMFYLLLFAVCVLILIMFVTLFYVFSQASGLRPLGPIFIRLTFLRQIALTYNRLLALNFVRILMAAGLNDNRSFELAAMLANDPKLANIEDNSNAVDESLAGINLARKAANLEPELEYQLGELSDQLVSEFNSARQKSMMAGYLVLAIFVGLFVIAMYLPLFQLGEIG